MSAGADKELAALARERGGARSSAPRRCCRRRDSAEPLRLLPPARHGRAGARTRQLRGVASRRWRRRAVVVYARRRDRRAAAATAAEEQCEKVGWASCHKTVSYARGKSTRRCAPLRAEGRRGGLLLRLGGRRGARSSKRRTPPGGRRDVFILGALDGARPSRHVPAAFGGKSLPRLPDRARRT